MPNQTAQAKCFPLRDIRSSSLGRLVQLLLERGMPYLNAGGSVSSPKQKPLQPPHRLPTQPPGLELHSIISSRSLRYFRDVAGMEQQKKTATTLTRKRETFSSLRARTRPPKLFPTPLIGCLTKRRSHNFLYGS